MRLLVASGISLLFLSLLVFLIVGGLLWGLELGEGSIVIALGVTILFNVILWLVSPFIQDFTQKWFYKVKWIDFDEFTAMSPKSAETVRRLSEKYGFALPKMGYIDDGNPTAYTYGSGPWNGRIVFSKGLVDFCNEDEISAVMAHEAGHIVHWDLAIMSAASLLLEIIYFVYVLLMRASRKVKKGPPLFIVAYGVYLGYLIGRGILLYLSRVREYYADKFASENTNPNHLASALIAISYGLVSTPGESDFLKGTQQLGIVNRAQAKRVVEGFESFGMDKTSNLGDVYKILQYDIYNPWAMFSEFFSTHPLTGKRIKAMMTMTMTPLINFNSADIESIDRGRMKRMFWGDIAGLFVPAIVAGMVLFGRVIPRFAVELDVDSLTMGSMILVIGVFFFAKSRRKFGGFSKIDPAVSTMISLAGDPYASPFKGTYACVEGTIIGKGTPGYMFDADMKLKDSTGLLYVDYSGLLGVLSNWFMGMTKIKKLIGSDVSVTGWFIRGMSYRLIANNVHTKDGKKVRSFGRMQAYIIPVLMLLFGLFVMFASF